MNTVKLAIVGSGPAGYTTAIYAARARLEPVIFTGVESGGQLMYTTDVENFPGFPEGILGPKLMMDLRAQATRFGADIRDQHVTAVDLTKRPFSLWTHLPDGVSPEIFKTGSAEKKAAVIAQVRQDKPDLLAESVILTTGATAITLGIPGERELMGRGVSTCAVCDAPFYRQKHVFVVGGGDSAMEDALALTKFAESVTIVHRRESFRASKIMAERVLTHPKITVLWNSTIEAVIGTETVEKVVLNQAGKQTEHPAQGLFFAIGHRPVTEVFQDQLELTAGGYIVTGQSPTAAGAAMATARVAKRDLVAFPTMTSVEGVFAAGDVVDLRYRQAVTAAGMGCAAALDAERWLEHQ